MTKLFNILASCLFISAFSPSLGMAKTVTASDQQTKVKSIEQFAKGSNDGVFSLSQEQAAYLGADEAVAIGFFGFSLDRNTQRDLQVGSSFDAATVLNSVKEKKHAASIYALLNGDNDFLDYSGSYLGPLGTTTLKKVGEEYYSSIAILFGPGKLSLNGGVTFDSARADGAFHLTFAPPLDIGAAAPAPVPLPTSLPFLAAGLGLLAAGGQVVRRRKMATA